MHRPIIFTHSNPYYLQQGVLVAERLQVSGSGNDTEDAEEAHGWLGGVWQ